MNDTVNFNLRKLAIERSFSEDKLKLSDAQKIDKIAHHFAQIMHTLGLNLNDDGLVETPNRVAKMYVQEIFSGLNPNNKPDISVFENDFGYKSMLVEKDITLYSNCEHHFVPIIGIVHVAYIPGNKVIGLSKINRLVQYYAQRPQVQERLTIQISDSLKEVLKNNDVAVVIEADHLCVASRGITDTNSKTFTASYSGQFEKHTVKQEFLSHIHRK